MRSDLFKYVKFLNYFAIVPAQVVKVDHNYVIYFRRCPLKKVQRYRF